MFKKILLIAMVSFLCFSTASLASRQEIQVDSTIIQACIYPQSAMLIREGQLQLEQGFYSITFDHILESFNENSIRVDLRDSIDSDARINGVTLETILLEEEPEGKIRDLQNEISRLEEQTRRLESKKNSINDRKAFLHTIIYFYQEHNGKTEGIVQIPSTEDLVEVYDFLGEELTASYDQLLDYEFQIETNQEKIDFLQKQLHQISSGQKETKRVIVVDLEVYQKKNFTFLLSYQIEKGVGWKPVYDARINMNKNRIDLITQAFIHQATGMDWTDIQVSLSTSRPKVSGEMPPVESWFLHLYLPDQRMGKMTETSMALQEKVAPALEDRTAEREWVVPVEQKGTSVTFHVPQPISIPSGSSPMKVFISEDSIAGEFSFKAIPRMSPYFYANALLKNVLTVPLLPGEVNIFIDGEFSGHTSLDYTPSGKDFDLSMGIAENIRLRRELIQKFRDETLISTIPSSKIVTKYEYKITVENYQNRESLCQIYESIPVPEDDRIQVTMEHVSAEPKIRDWQERKGVWMWEFQLQPQEKAEIDVIYSISHPRDMQIIGLP